MESADFGGRQGLLEAGRLMADGHEVLRAQKDLEARAVWVLLHEEACAWVFL